jgi:hypothetical protein
MVTTLSASPSGQLYFCMESIKPEMSRSTERKQCAIKQSNRKRYQTVVWVRITKTFEVKPNCTLCRKYTCSDERCAAYLQNFRHKEKNYESFSSNCPGGTSRGRKLFVLCLWLPASFFVSDRTQQESELYPRCGVLVGRACVVFARFLCAIAIRIRIKERNLTK